MTNPLKEHGKIEAIIIAIDSKKPFRTTVSCSSYSKLAYLVTECLKRHNEYECIVMVGGEILTGNEVEQIRQVSENSKWPELLGEEDV